MRLWRVSGRHLAEAFDGGYGLRFDGRWNTVGHPVTYAATSPSLCVLEKLVHVEDPMLLPSLAVVAYDAPDEIPFGRRTADDLPDGWRHRESETQGIGNEWLASLEAAVLFVPSVIVPIRDCPDQNVVINHLHPAAATITIARIEPFELDVRLL
jgi:RES domain-containing protein